MGLDNAEGTSSAKLDKWQTLPEADTLGVIKAYSHPIRRIILALLETKPMRKSDIARYIHRFFGKKYARSLIQHHLKLLERAGLVGYMDNPEPESKAKLAYLAAKIRIQIKPEPKPKSIDLITKDLVEMEFWQRFKEQIGKERQPPAT
ncbi:MAG: winged helix-turn-helix domain-containing protein [Candidatus Hadarchaeum sp.]